LDKIDFAPPTKRVMLAKQMGSLAHIFNNPATNIGINPAFLRVTLIIKIVSHFFRFTITIVFQKLDPCQMCQPPNKSAKSLLLQLSLNWKRTK
jgi:hypothetical protein